RSDPVARTGSPAVARLPAPFRRAPSGLSATDGIETREFPPVRAPDPPARISAARCPAARRRPDPRHSEAGSTGALFAVCRSSSRLQHPCQQWVGLGAVPPVLPFEVIDVVVIQGAERPPRTLQALERGRDPLFHHECVLQA